MAEQVPWEKLSESSRAYVIGFIRRLADGYSGDLLFKCHDGGVAKCEETLHPKPQEFEDYGDKAA